MSHRKGTPWRRYVVDICWDQFQCTNGVDIDQSVIGHFF